MISEAPKKNIGLLYGLVNAVVQVIFTVILYLSGVKVFTSGFSNAGVILPLVITVLGGLQLKKLQGGYLEFSEALKTTFMILVIGSFISMVFDYVLLNYIDISFRDAAMQIIAEKTERALEKFGMAQDQIDKITEETLNGNNYTFGKLFLGFAFKCIFLFLGALIISAIIKKKRPPFENNFNQ